MPNNLSKENNPYLLQHANNPVNWFSWCDEAFEKAKAENKPVFLSIGYSTCHWCHVMEKESFEDDEVAKILNEHFISIKVDREERPDLDQIYMTVCQIMTRQGGWPLTIFMSPDKIPFFAGTYFPKESHHGRIGFIDLILEVVNTWENKSDEIKDFSIKIIKILEDISTLKINNFPRKEILDKAFDQIQNLYDYEHGGFGSAPKFPTPQKFLFLLRYWKRTKNEKALEMVEETLTYMKNGGIYDHIGFGFHRYSTDREWLVPHFEKMLYDQALLAIAYLEAFQATKNEEFANVANDIFNYVLRALTDKNGGFYSAQDADSDGEEGKFYTWTGEEIESILGNDAELFIKTFNIKQEGNFLDEITRSLNKKNIPYLNTDIKLTKDEKIKLDNIKKKLFSHREKRGHPLTDDKILTDWNGLMIAAFARGGVVLNNPTLTKHAKKSTDFILGNLYKNKKLFHRFRNAEVKTNACLNDYAFLIWGLLELYESCFELEYLTVAMELSETMIEKFYDKESFGFFTTSSDETDLIIRLKEIYDSAIPSGNSIAILCLIKLFKITDNEKYEKIYQDSLKALSSSFENSPVSHIMFMVCLEYIYGKSFEIVLSSEIDSDFLHSIRSKFIPNKIILGGNNINISNISPITKDKIVQNKKNTVWICENQTCKNPISDINKLENIFD